MRLAGFLETLVGWIGPIFASAGYWIVSGAVTLERSIFIGLVVPGDVILAMGGIYSARGHLEIEWVIALGTIAGIVGESAGYWLGRRYGVTLVGGIPLIRRLEKRLNEAKKYFEEHGGKTVAIGRYASAIGALIPFVAGIARMPYAKFLAFDVPAVVVWAVGFSLVGYFFGANLETVDSILSRFGWIMFGVLVVLVGAVVVARRRRRR
ncbi:MAG TPA: DedA family protein [Actinomycetota bacterium]|nr:DedA family protein [Actinomycetota bacterium]